MTNSNSTTICALSTAPGRAGVAVVRVTGSSAGQLVAALAGPLPDPRRATLRTLRDPKSSDVIDRGLVLWLPGPESFTGENCAEFQVHGGPAVIEAVLAALTDYPDCRLAEPGEFSRRAFANGKLDLAEAEGVADLIEAETRAQRIQALRQAGGTLSSLYEAWRARLIDAAALTEAAIDFSDEGDVATDALAKARTMISEVLPEIQAHLDDGHRGEILRDGFRVVLAGAPNVGKSSLLNALARRDVAIVSAEAGTTRDVVEVRLDLAGYPVIVSDTAGLRAHAGAIEQEGMRRAKDAASAAHLVLWLTDDWANPDVEAAMLPALDGTILTVLTKADLQSDDDPGSKGDERSDRNSERPIVLSAKTGQGVDTLIRAITVQAEHRLKSTSPAPVLTQLRHRQAVSGCAGHLQAFLASSADEAELRAEDLRAAGAALGRITGRVDVEDILDQVFGRFCIGK